MLRKRLAKFVETLFGIAASRAYSPGRILSQRNICNATCDISLTGLGWARYGRAYEGTHVPP